MIERGKLVIEVHELLFAVMFLFTFTSFSVGGINISDKILWIIVTGVLFLKHIQACAQFLIGKCLLYIIFVLFGILGVFFLNEKARILFFDFNYIFQIMFFAVVVYIFSAYNLSYERFLKIIYRFGVFTGIIGILQYFFWGPVTRIISIFVEAVYDNLYTSTHRIGSLYDNPNLFASIMVCMSLLGILLWLESNERKYLFEVAIMVIALLFTETRGALLVFTVGVLHICFLKQYGKQRLKSFTLVILLSTAAQYVISSGLLSRFAVFFSGTNNYEVMTGRRNIIWNTLISQGTNNIFYGIGNGMSEIVTKNIIGQSYGPHSMYVGIISETGVLGAIAFFMFLFLILFKGIRIEDKKLRHIFIVLYVAMLLLQVTESHLRAFMQFIMLFWLVASIPFSNKMQSQDGTI